MPPLTNQRDIRSTSLGDWDDDHGTPPPQYYYWADTLFSSWQFLLGCLFVLALWSLSRPFARWVVKLVWVVGGSVWVGGREVEDNDTSVDDDRIIGVEDGHDQPREPPNPLPPTVGNEEHGQKVDESQQYTPSQPAPDDKEPDILKQCRLAVRAVLHLAEVSPEVAAVANATIFNNDTAAAQAHRTSQSKFRGSMALSQPYPTLGQRPPTFTHADKRQGRVTKPSVGTNSLRNRSKSKGRDVPSTRSRSQQRRSAAPSLADVFPETRIQIQSCAPQDGTRLVVPDETMRAGSGSAVGPDDQNWLSSGGLLNDPSKFRSSMVSMSSGGSSIRRRGSLAYVPESSMEGNSSGLLDVRPSSGIQSTSLEIPEAPNKDTSTQRNRSKSRNRGSLKQRRHKRRSRMIDTSVMGDHGLPSASSAESPKSARGSTERHYYSAEHVHEWLIPGFGRVKFTDHAPVAFRAVRTRFGYSFEELESALSGACRFEHSEGKSDAVFFSTNDKRFLFKTLRGSEPESLKSFLPDYLAHVTRFPSTLLPRYIGLYTFERVLVHTPSNLERATPSTAVDDATASLGTKFTIVCMANVFDTPLEIHSKFDFKGSNIGRRTLPDDHLTAGGGGGGAGVSRPVSMDAGIGISSTTSSGTITNGTHSVRQQRSVDESHMPSPERVTLKELDYQRLVAFGKANLFSFGEEMKGELMRQLEEDVGLLRKHGFMDYSFLIGVHKKRREREREREKPPLFPGTFVSGSMSGSGTQKRERARTIRRSTAAEIANSFSSGVSSVFGGGAGAGAAAAGGEGPTLSSSLRPPEDTVLPGYSGDGYHRGNEGAPFSPILQTAASVLSRIVGSYMARPERDIEAQVEVEVSDARSIGGGGSRRGSDARGLDEHFGESDSWSDEDDGGNSSRFKRFNGGIRSTDLQDGEFEYEVYFVGLIDVLQKYNFAKWLERGLKKGNMFAPPSLSGIFNSGASNSTSSPNLPIYPSTPDPNGGPTTTPYTPSRRGSTPLQSHTRTFSFSSMTKVFQRGSSAEPSVSLSPSSLEPDNNNNNNTYPTPRTSMESNGSEGSRSTASSPPAVTSPLLRSHGPGYGSLTPVGSPGVVGGGGRQVVVPGLDAFELSVEEPGRYANRLVEFIGGIVI
ncbi:hypothetical protein HDV00_000114 [Rhizophlyctis rosea]|nr:hypothetical protein HDV00_000114 [Rhizophlyctis rosea]